MSAGTASRERSPQGFKNSKTLKRVLEDTPIEYLVTETDCPYLAPEPFRGKRNDSRNIRYVIQEIARLKEMEETRTEEILFENARKVYGVRTMPGDVSVRPRYQ